MGSSNSVAPSSLVSLALGQEIDLTELTATECVQLLRGYVTFLQPSHKFLPAKAAEEITADVRPLSSRVVDIPRNHVFWRPVKYQGVHSREKCVALHINFGFARIPQRKANSESYRQLFWTRSGELAVLISYHSNDVGGIVAYDFVALTDQQLLEAFTAIDKQLTRNMLFKIINSLKDCVENMVEKREAEAQKHRKRLNAAAQIASSLQNPMNRRPFSY